MSGVVRLFFVSLKYICPFFDMPSNRMYGIFDNVCAKVISSFVVFVNMCVANRCSRVHVYLFVFIFFIQSKKDVACFIVFFTRNSNPSSHSYMRSSSSVHVEVILYCNNEKYCSHV